MTRCTCGVAARWWRPAANPMHGGAYCQNSGRVFPYQELVESQRPPTNVTGAAALDLEIQMPEREPAPVGIDRAGNEEDARRVRGQDVNLIYDDGINYGPGVALTTDMSAFLLESSFDQNREKR